MAVDPPDPVVAIDGLTKSYGSLRVLDGVSLAVDRGEAVALIGPSGSGKTTLLRCVNFLETFEGGSIRIEGRPIGYDEAPSGRRLQSDRTIAAARARISMVFQGYNLFPHMTVLGNLTVGPTRVLGIPAAEIRPFALHLLAEVGLADKADVYPHALSGGQQQRVAIARALAMRPTALLLDEITSALDPELVGEVLSVVRRLIGQGMTMLIVTHEMQFARDAAHRAVFMEGGRIVEEGVAADLFARPRTPRLSTFLQRHKP